VKESLQKDLRQNTRVAIDPFISPEHGWEGSSSCVKFLKRKHRDSAMGAKIQPGIENAAEKTKGSLLGLDDYNSDD
jgi:hypothetical protein